MSTISWLESSEEAHLVPKANPEHLQPFFFVITALTVEYMGFFPLTDF